MAWTYQAIRGSAIETGLGYLQIAARGYYSEGATDPSGFLVTGVPPGVATLGRDSRAAPVTGRSQADSSLEKGAPLNRGAGGISVPLSEPYILRG